MPGLTIYSVIESAAFPNLAPLFQRIGAEEVRLDSTRKAISQLKKRAPDFIIGEFVYGWSNNYSGVHISNLDTILASLPKYAPQTKVIVLVKKAEREYAEKLAQMFPVLAIVELPLGEAQLEGLIVP